jgi:hypothetical protein
MEAIMPQIMLSRDTYLKLLRVAEVTHLDIEEWADAVLAEKADELLQQVEEPKK